MPSKKAVVEEELTCSHKSQAESCLLLFCLLYPWENNATAFEPYL